MTKKYTRSVSQMKSVLKCGEQFALSRGFRGPRIPKRPWPQTVAGIAFHEMIVQWERAERSLDPLSIFEVEWEKALEEAKEEQPDLDLWMRPPGRKSVGLDSIYKRFIEKDVPLYIERCKEAEWEVFTLPSGELALEIPFEVEFGDLLVKGTIDRVQWWPKQGMVSVEDTKSGSPEGENDSRQLGLYRFGIESALDIDLTHGRYWFTKVDRGSDWVDLRRFTKEMLADHYQKLDRIIQEDLLLPNPGKQCDVCDARPYCPIMGWLQPGEELG